MFYILIFINFMEIIWLIHLQLPGLFITPQRIVKLGLNEFLLFRSMQPIRLLRFLSFKLSHITKTLQHC